MALMRQIQEAESRVQAAKEKQAEIQNAKKDAKKAAKEKKAAEAKTAKAKKAAEAEAAKEVCMPLLGGLRASRMDPSTYTTVGSDSGSTWVSEHAGAPTPPSRPCRTARD
eukprot:4640254-Prymnesium_polylepis.1